MRVHGTTEEAPRVALRARRSGALRPLAGRPPFRQVRELVRMVGSECSDRAGRQQLQRAVAADRRSGGGDRGGGRVAIRHDGTEVAAHAETAGRRQRVIDPAHFHGMPGLARPAPRPAAPPEPLPPALLRPLAEYEQAIGGGW